MRVIDESGEDYLYPADYFVSVELPQKAKRAGELGALTKECEISGLARRE